jgi:predicted Zn-dependent protease
MVVSTDLTKLGSPSALSLLANSETIPAMVSAGVVLAVSAALFTYAEFKSYQDKKHKEKVEKVNAFYSLHLKQIIVPHRGKIHGFPPIFQLIDGKYQSMHFTPEQVKDIGSDVIHGSDIALSSYRESVRAAIKKLQEYYFVRKEDGKVKADDVTAGVLSYLMQMLDTKCLNFLGYDYDIAYLDAICKFINAYSSQDSGEKSQHFSRLAPVYMHLLKAKQKLEKHKEVLSLQETVAELKDSCVSHSDHLIRMLVKMVVNDADTDLADTVAHEELQDGILRQHYIHSEIKGVEIWSDKEIKIPSSIFREWIKNLSEYYLKSLSVDLKEENKISSPNIFFALLNKAKSMLGRKLFGHSKELEEIEHELRHIRKVFRESGNFISTRFNKISKKFEIVSDPLHLIDRSLVMANIAKLAHELISLQYLCAHLLKSIQLLGDIYVSNPAHFCKIFQVLESLCILIKADVLATKKAFIELQEDNQNNMQIEEKEAFPNQIRDLLESVFGEIKDIGEQVKECRQMAIKTIPSRTVKSVKYEMLEIATIISNMYFANFNEHGEEQNLADELQNDICVNIPEESSKQTIDESREQEQSVVILEQLTQSIYRRIMEIQKIELYRSKTYFNVYDALVSIKDKTVALLNENSSLVERHEKADKMLLLTSSLLKETLTFVMRSTAERQAGAIEFFNSIQRQLNDKENGGFIDRHHNFISRYVYTNICSQGFFRTDTRKKLATFEEACLQATH